LQDEDAERDRIGATGQSESSSRMMSGEIDVLLGGRASPGRVIRVCTMAMGIFALMVLTLHFSRYLVTSIRAIVFPFQLDYGEGIVWQQAEMIPDGAMYGDITRYPFIVFHYPPLYHLMVRLLQAFGVYPLIAGRLVSFVSGLVICACVAAIVHGALRPLYSQRAAMIASITAPLILISMYPFAAWSVVMRVDMLAIAMNFVGVVLVLRSFRRPLLFYVAMSCFVIAVYSKQTEVVAATATTAVIFMFARGVAIRVLCFGLVLGLIPLAILMVATDGGFLRHIILYNVNRFDLWALYHAGAPAVWHLMYLVLAVIGLWLGWRGLAPQSGRITLSILRDRVCSNPFDRVLVLVTLYLIGTTCLLVTLAKSGSWFNYLVEWMCVWSVAIGLLVGRCVAVLDDAPHGRGFGPVHAFATFAAIAVQAVALPQGWNAAALDGALYPEMSRLQAMVADTDKPVLSDDMVLLMRAGKTVPWEPSIFSELAGLGRWDESLIIDRIHARQFAFVITSGSKGDPVYDSRFNPAVDAAIAQAYPKVVEMAGYLVHEAGQ
jgi:hypothetical protein